MLRLMSDCWRPKASRARRLHLVDLQYSDVRLDKGLYNRLVARGSMQRLVTEAQVREIERMESLISELEHRNE